MRCGPARVLAASLLLGCAAALDSLAAAPASRTGAIPMDDGGGAEQPTVTGVRVTSDPGADGRYLAGEAVEVEVRFHVGVQVERFASPTLALDVGRMAREAAFTEYVGPARDRLVFRYVVGPEDRDADGFGVPADALAGNGHGDLRGRIQGGAAVLDLGAHAVASVVGHPVGPVALSEQSDRL